MRYTDNGTVFFKRSVEAGVESTAWAVQINYVMGAGAPFKTIKWANWMNPHMPYSFQETNESPDMFGWQIATDADIVLYAYKEIPQLLERIKSLVRLGYRGVHATPDILMDEIEWKMSQ